MYLTTKFGFNSFLFFIFIIFYINKFKNSYVISFFLVYYAQLPGIAKMFSSEMTLASAWIHLLVVDLFAARSLSLSLSLSLSVLLVVVLSSNTSLNTGRFFMMDWKTKLRLGIQFLFACFFVPLESLLMSSPKH